MKFKNAKEVAAAYGVSASSVSRWVNRGCPKNPDGSFTRSKVDNWLANAKVVDRRTAGTLPDLPTQTTVQYLGDLTEQLAQAKLNKERLIAVRHQIQIDTARGTVVPLESVEKQWSLYVSQAAIILESLGEQLMAYFSDVDPDKRLAIERMVSRVIRSTKRALSGLDQDSGNSSGEVESKTS